MKKSIFGFAAAMLLACTVAFAGNEAVNTACRNSCSPTTEASCKCATAESCDDCACSACTAAAISCCSASTDEEAACCEGQPECSCE